MASSVFGTGKVAFVVAGVGVVTGTLLAPTVALAADDAQRAMPLPQLEDPSTKPLWGPRGARAPASPPPLPPPPPVLVAPFESEHSGPADRNSLELREPLVTAQCTLSQQGDVRCEKTRADISFTKREVERTWYGWQTILTDGASLGLAGSAPFTKSIGSALGAVGAYMLLPPLIHVFHGHGGRAERSLGMRLGFPLAGAFLFPVAYFAYGSSGSSRVDFCRGSDKNCLEGLAILSGAGAVTGLIAAMVVDAMGSYDERTVERKVTRQVSWGPTVGVDATGARVALAGSF